MKVVLAAGVGAESVGQAFSPRTSALGDLFWSNPRLPLLPAGESDLQPAIFEAVSGGQLRLVGADGLDRAITRLGEFGVPVATDRILISAAAAVSRRSACR